VNRDKTLNRELRTEKTVNRKESLVRFKKKVAPAVFMLFFFQPAIMPGVSHGLCFAAEGVSSSNDASGRARYPDVDFRWAFAATTVQDGKTIAQPVTQNMVLKSGDQIKMMVELQRRCFVYLFHEDEKGDVQLLFPYALQQFDTDYQPESKYFIPRGEAWFRLDENPGREVFYLVASAKRLDDLEKAYLKHESADQASRAETAKAIFDKIRELRRTHSELASPAERPTPMGGALRGVEKARDTNRFEISDFADEVLSTGGFAARTYTIEHK
jgi:hypothetical protein